MEEGSKGTSSESRVVRICRVLVFYAVFGFVFPNRHSCRWIRTAKLIYSIFFPYPIRSLIKLTMTESRKLQDGRSLGNHLDQAPILRQRTSEVQRKDEQSRIRQWWYK